MKSVPDDSQEGLIAAAWFFGAGMFLFVCGVVLLWFSCLRETREFWFNSGGYPVLLRDVVRIFYYPLLAFCFLGTLGLMIGMCAKIRMPVGFVCFQICLITGCCLLIAGSIMVSATNNLDNLWNGRPMHYKPPLIKR